MNKRIKMNLPFFVILGGMNGALISLVACFFLDYMVTSYTTTIALTYLDWVLVCAPCFALVGCLFNLAAAIFMYEDETKIEKKVTKRKKK